jgi:hypothetical protein
MSSGQILSFPRHLIAIAIMLSCGSLMLQDMPICHPKKDGVHSIPHVLNGVRSGGLI